jgi:Zn-dependent M28 family amino/carboxypeptidase
MKLLNSRTLRAAQPSPDVAAVLETVADEGKLRKWVTQIALPRHFTAERQQNQATAAWLADLFASLGYRVERQGPWVNVLAFPQRELAGLLFVGAHYDSVPQCPGADDNASALAAMLGCAAACARWNCDLPVGFAAFNREEEHLVGSRDFVEVYLPTTSLRIRCVHILEMVGYTSLAPGGQTVPTGLPIELSQAADFIGLLANGQSGTAMELAVHHVATYTPQLPATGLEVATGAERMFPVLGRSDHVPFWACGIPAMMWTDTAEFRNRHYHQPSDTPETLDYTFLRRVTQALTATVIDQATSMGVSD